MAVEMSSMKETGGLPFFPLLPPAETALCVPTSSASPPNVVGVSFSVVVVGVLSVEWLRTEPASDADIAQLFSDSEELEHLPPKSRKPSRSLPDVTEEKDPIAGALGRDCSPLTSVPRAPVLPSSGNKRDWGSSEGRSMSPAKLGPQLLSPCGILHTFEPTQGFACLPLKAHFSRSDMPAMPAM